MGCFLLGTVLSPTPLETRLEGRTNPTGLPPEWADVHHLDPWGSPTGGPTDIDNGLGMCRPHHVLVHEHGWQPVQSADGTWHLQPP